MDRNMNKLYGALLLVLSVLISCTSVDHHFLTDKDYRQQVENDFNTKLQLVGSQFYAPTLDMTAVPLCLYAHC